MRLNAYRRPPEDFEGQAYVGEGTAINSGFLDGLVVEEAKRRMIAWLERERKGRRAVTYRLRDWLFSRQRYYFLKEFLQRTF